jgi:MoaA/NifB/PqqE/SkfB family radical SAM enzyme
MRLGRAFACGSALLEARAGLRVPFVLSWRLNFRCNLRCQYCHIPLTPTEELSAGEILTALRGFRRAGTHLVNFTGGEVLLRDDIGEIIDGAADLGISATLNTNGLLLPKRIDAIRRASGVTLSLDGEEEVHDSVRGRGTQAQVLAAIRTARGAGLRVAVTAVLSSHNLDSVPWLLAWTARERVPVTFQPARLEKLGSDLPDPVTPPLAAYRKAMALVLRAKRAGNPWIINSLDGLEHLDAFPARQDIGCYAGKVFFSVEPNGDLLACHDLRKPEVIYNVVRDGVERALAMTSPGGCEECWCPSLVELNLAGRLRPGVILNMVRQR